MTLYQAMVNRLVTPVIQAHEARGREVGRAEGKVEGRAEGLVKGRAEGLAEGRVEGLAEGRGGGSGCRARPVGGLEPPSDGSRRQRRPSTNPRPAPSSRRAILRSPPGRRGIPAGSF